jgi:hypothetical protein
MVKSIPSHSFNFILYLFFLGEEIALRRPNAFNITSTRSAINFIPSIPGVNEDSVITCATVLSSKEVVLGYNRGDIAYVEVDGQGQVVGRAVILKDVTMVQSLLSSFLARSSDATQSYDIIALTKVEGRSGLVVAVSSLGVVRLWDVSRKKCLCATPLNDAQFGENAGHIGVSGGIYCITSVILQSLTGAFLQLLCPRPISTCLRVTSSSCCPSPFDPRQCS